MRSSSSLGTLTAVEAAVVALVPAPGCSGSAAAILRLVPELALRLRPAPLLRRLFGRFREELGCVLLLLEA